MAYRANPVPIPPNPPSNIVSLRNYKGLNVLNSMTEIDDEESPQLLNVIVNDFGRFETRRGYNRYFPTSLGNGAVHGLYNYIKADGTSILLMVWNTTLYKVNPGAAPTAIPTPHGLDANNRVRFFTMNDLCWINDNVNFYRFDGTTVVDVTSIAKIPTISISRAPNGSATNVNEDINLMQPGFTESFSGTASDTLYYLSYQGLDATPVTIVANNVNRTEGTHFTVNRAAGTINFAAGTAPLGSPGAGTNNVQITAYKTWPGNADIIKHCAISVLYGGKNDTKVWLAGDNSNFVNFSGNYDPTYWPENNFMRIGADSDAIMGFSIQYDTLVVQKERSKWQISFTTDNTGQSMYILKPINDTIGCIAIDSVQTLNNSPVTLTEYGVFMLKSSDVRDERNVESISLKIDKNLLNENYLNKAVSVDFDNKYILVLNNNAYVFDYRVGSWFFWDNIKASCFEVIDGELYFGSNTDGLVYKFLLHDSLAFLDDGQDIENYWYTKIFNFGNANSNKYVESIFYSILPTAKSNVQLYYRTDQTEFELVGDDSLELFNYAGLDYSTFTYKADIYPTIIRCKLKAKKIKYIQFMFKCNKSNAQMAILNIDIKFSIQNFIK